MPHKDFEIAQGHFLPDKLIKLETPKDVMLAFLCGKKLVNSCYGVGNADYQYLFLSESGYICEEDHAGAKNDRVPIAMRNCEWWASLEI